MLIILRKLVYLLIHFQIHALNNDPNVHGIIVQMPLDSDNPIDSNLITDSVCPEKDVDGYVKIYSEFKMRSLKSLLYFRLHTINEGRTAIGNLTGFIPCTPNGCIELIKRSNVQIAGAKAVVLGEGSFYF